MERHLWVNLAEIGNKARNFLNALALPSYLFATFVETVIWKFREVKPLGGLARLGLGNKTGL